MNREGADPERIGLGAILDDPRAAKTGQPSRIFHLILGLLLLFFIVQPLAARTIVGVGIIQIFFSALLIGSLLAVTYKKGLFIVGSFLVVVAIVLRFVSSGSVPLMMARDVFAIGAFLFMAAVFLLRVLSYRHITAASVSGALCVYIFIGLIWTFTYSTLERIVPGSFNGLEQGAESTHQLFYFSFVTLTTLGYGDITPARPVAMTLATGEAIVGQLFLVAFVAYLVGRSISSTMSTEINE